MLPKVDARPKVFSFRFFCLFFFRHYARFFRKFSDSVKGYPLHFFEDLRFRFVKTFNQPEWPLFEFFGIVRLKKMIRKKISKIIFLKKLFFIFLQMFPIVVP